MSSRMAWRTAGKVGWGGGPLIFFLMAESALGAMFEVLVDGVPRLYRDTRLTAMGAAQFL